MTRDRLSGTRVLVTGAAGAIGAATAGALRQRGARVVGIDREPGDDVLGADLRDDEEIARAVVDAIGRLDGLDVLINNAGVGDAHDAGAPPDERAIAVVDVNLFGAWRVTGHAMPALLASRGRVINVASGLAVATLPLSSAYAASKRALVAWSDALRLEYGGTVSVSTVYPGYIRTPIHDAAAERGVSMEGALPAEPLKATVRTIVRACAATHPRRHVATTLRGGIAYGLARGVPGIAERVVAAWTSRIIRSDRFVDAAIAENARRHMIGLRRRK